MSESVKKTTQQEETEEKKPVAKKKSEKKDGEKKPNVFKRGWNWMKENKRAIGAFGLGVGTGVVGAVGGAVVMNKRKERKAREAAYIAEPAEYVAEPSPLDPNVD